MENYESENLSNNQLKNINEENNEIIIELEIDLSDKEIDDEEIYILCDKNSLIENNKLYKNL